MTAIIFKKSLIVSAITVFLDFLFHLIFTNPMESVTYFVIKFLLAFFVATGMYSLKHYKNSKNILVPTAGIVFSLLMSIYYRAWELGEAHVPFGSRAPDILLVSRGNMALFSGIWLAGHAAFFVIGAIIAGKIIRK